MGQSPMKRLVRSFPGLATLLHAGLWTGECTPPGYKVTGRVPGRSEAPSRLRGKTRRSSLARASTHPPPSAQNDPACLALDPLDKFRLEGRAGASGSRPMRSTVDLLDDRRGGDDGRRNLPRRETTAPVPRSKGLTILASYKGRAVRWSEPAPAEASAFARPFFTGLKKNMTMPTAVVFARVPGVSGGIGWERRPPPPRYPTSCPSD
jgi:hypothetical protein